MTEENQAYRVLLYYNYTNVEDPENFAAEHLAFCKELGLKGRIIVAEEGINGTVSGTVDQTEAYMQELTGDERFKDTEFKVDYAEGHAFKKMHVRPRSELVSLYLEDDINPNEQTGEHLSPKEFYEALQSDETIVLDARNDYEYDLGHFRGAIRPDINAFRELPDWVRENREKLEGKKILTYCTGGIRCEKFSGFLKEEGFDDVAQLHGGIVSYGKDPEVKGELWDGKCYVFDQRISVPINQVEHRVIGRDHFDGEPCERYVNCADPDCNNQIICSEENEHKYMRSCTTQCMTHPRNRYMEEHGLSKEDVERKIEARKAEQMQNA
ncbi:oxygen-dependent tRNA uridine(34) hydroxylase TrhO [Marinococcus halophilus]|uniref:oxygen-dependent tRNA uridine(34) hydroxylase TrhO n=1 Tax=Marinococcus halophilus TaxID=1371 RepID=UPI0009A67215|nr:rhodanese-related sulfurtransferase [Marinococcus halophilus]